MNLLPDTFLTVHTTIRSSLGPVTMKTYSLERNKISEMMNYKQLCCLKGPFKCCVAQWGVGVYGSAQISVTKMCGLTLLRL